MDNNSDNKGVVILTGIQHGEGEVAIRVDGEGARLGTLEPLGPDTPEGEEVLTFEGEGPVLSVVDVARVVSGPAKCNSRDFRAGWDRIFGGHHQVASA